MKRHQLLNLSIFLFLFSCVDNTQYLESKKDYEAGFVVKNYPDSILIDYRKYKDPTFNSSSKLVKRGDEFWAIHQPENENSQYVNFSDKEFQDYVYLSWKEHKAHLVDELDLVDDSILVYRLDEKYLTEVKSNGSPVKRIYYYDRDYRIDSVIWIIAKDTMVYK
ncbi:hypothetical protein [Moheibacter stercoris]|uniref:Lipoprotein n=1 Tax=Moheibacter stercoris TaxID=1628251 RepID=A0ABV2LST2_9FLAO